MLGHIHCFLYSCLALQSHDVCFPCQVITTAIILFLIWLSAIFFLLSQSPLLESDHHIITVISFLPLTFGVIMSFLVLPLHCIVVVVILLFCWHSPVPVDVFLLHAIVSSSLFMLIVFWPSLFSYLLLFVVLHHYLHCGSALSCLVHLVLIVFLFFVSLLAFGHRHCCCFCCSFCVWTLSCACCCQHSPVPFVLLSCCCVHVVLFTFPVLHLLLVFVFALVLLSSTCGSVLLSSA